MRALLIVGILLALAPTGATLPATCADPCTVTSDVDLYTTPLAIVASGTTVTFTASSGSHVNVDGSGIGENGSCIATPSSASQDGNPYRLTIQDGALYAEGKDLLGVDGVRECLSATALPDGSFALPFHCTLHPSMRGSLVVTPA